MKRIFLALSLAVGLGSLAVPAHAADEATSQPYGRYDSQFASPGG
jgi:hypothetical protein